jgi:hypothetical protein
VLGREGETTLARDIAEPVWILEQAERVLHA